MTLSVNDIQHTGTQHNNALCYDDCHYGECRILFIVMLIVIIMIFVMLSVIMPNVFLLNVVGPLILLLCLLFYG